VQRTAIDKQLVETVGRYARPENSVLFYSSIHYCPLKNGRG